MRVAVVGVIGLVLFGGLALSVVSTFSEGPPPARVEVGGGESALERSAPVLVPVADSMRRAPATSPSAPERQPAPGPTQSGVTAALRFFGTVSDSAGRPIFRAVVTTVRRGAFGCALAFATTSESGRFTLSSPRRDDLTFRVRAAGYFDAIVDAVEGEANFHLRRSLTAGVEYHRPDAKPNTTELFGGGRTVRLCGTVRDRDTGRALADVKLEVSCSGRLATAHTDRNGEYLIGIRVGRDATGIVGITARQFGYDRASITTHLPSRVDGSITRDFALRPTPIVTGVVVTPFGVPVPDAIISLQHRSVAPRAVVRTNGTGRFALAWPDRVAARRLKAVAEGFGAGYSVPIDRSQSRLDGLRIVLTPEHVIAVRVRDATGAPVAGRSVLLSPEAARTEGFQSGVFATRLTDESGRCRFRSLAPGAYLVAVGPRSFDDVEKPRRVLLGPRRFADVQLQWTGPSARSLRATISHSIRRFGLEYDPQTPSSPGFVGSRAWPSRPRAWCSTQ